MMGLWRMSALIACFAVVACAPQTRMSGTNIAAELPSTRTMISVTVPAGTPTVYLTGNLDTLGPWQADAIALQGSGTERTAEIAIPPSHRLEYKFTLGDWTTEAVDAQDFTMPNFVRAPDASGPITHALVGFRQMEAYLNDIAGAGLQGDLTYWLDVTSKHLTETRHVSIWTPPGYDPESEQTYRVIYMSDGQNLFDPRIANTGVDWGVDEAMMDVAVQTGTEPAIVVASWSTARRAYEYSPWHDADDYAAFLLDELMPRVAANYKVATGPENTFHMGSSMGGLLSFYMVMNHPDVFGACGCVSTHVTWSPYMFARWVEQRDGAGVSATPYIITAIEAGLTPPSNVRMWFDYGALGLDADYGGPHREMYDWLLANNRVEGTDFVMREYAGADHNEASWRARLTDPLTFLLAPDEVAP